MDIYERLVDEGCECDDEIDEVCTNCLAEKELASLKAENEKLRPALEGLLKNLDMEGPETVDEPDEDSVGWNGDGSPMTMTFGHIRRAKAALQGDE